LHEKGKALFPRRVTYYGWFIQQILDYESGVADVVDLLGGSYYVDSLINRMEQEIAGYLNKIEAVGV